MSFGAMISWLRIAKQTLSTAADTVACGHLLLPFLADWTDDKY